MANFNNLFRYRKYYEYDFDAEVVHIAQGEHHDEAKVAYVQAARQFFCDDQNRWALDIALDCVRNFKDEECSLILEKKEIFNYHFGYGMYVRNRYIYPAQLHFHLMPDHISSRVEEFIYAIMLFECDIKFK